MSAALPIVRRSATPQEALAAVAEAFEVVFGRRPTRSELTILAAQSAHETAGWRSMPNYNVAGLKEFNLSKPHYIAMTTEYVPGPLGPDGKPTRVKKRIPQPFAAYATLAGGMTSWLRLLARGYPQALSGARLGSVDLFVDGLLEGHGKSYDYFSAPRDDYEVRVEHWRADLDETLGFDFDAHCDPDAQTDLLRGRVLEATLLAIRMRIA